MARFKGYAVATLMQEEAISVNFQGFINLQLQFIGF